MIESRDERRYDDARRRFDSLARASYERTKGLADSRRDWVKGVLDDALVIVAELGVPADLAPVALAKAIDLLASGD